MIVLDPPRRLLASTDPWDELRLSRPALVRFLTRARKAVGLRGAVDLLLAGDGALRRLNRDFRGKDKATDVLSFPSPEEIFDERAGDLAISYKTAERQAKAFGHGLEDGGAGGGASRGVAAAGGVDCAGSWLGGGEADPLRG
jgi:probable rRNA maturation factor